MKFDNTNQVLSLYKKWGSQFYSEKVSQTAHAVQCALLAENNNESSALIIAALLHDIGHLIDLEINDGKEINDYDSEHEAAGARALSSLLPTSVTGPIALHVAAKRFLCTEDGQYLAQLSAASTHTLSLQGGPMSAAEVNRFRRMPHFEAAVALRLLDDQGKDSTQDVEPFNEFQRIFETHISQIQKSVN